MDWSLSISTLLQILTISTLAGMTYQSIQQLKRDVEKLEREVTDFRDLKSELAVIKTEIKQLNTTLQRYLEEAK